jgi:death-on-curing protein
MKPPVWVARETVLAVHEQLLAEFGGSSGLRDEGLLHSALGRPENLFGNGEPDLFDLVASYGFGLVKNHAFVDGNKRTGFAVAVLFLQLNGVHLEATETDATVQTLALAAGAIKESTYAAWLRKTSKRRR